MKTVLVTGGNRGIGFEIARQLGELGWTVILGSRDLQKGIAAAGKLGKNVHARQLDVTREDSMLNLFNNINTEFGGLDVLINNAGVGANSTGDDPGLLVRIKKIMEKDFTAAWKLLQGIKTIMRKTGMGGQGIGAKDVSLMSVRYVMETNFYGPWRMIQVFLPLLLKSTDGRIINLSSGMGELKSLSGLYPDYSLSKSSLNALTIMLSNELKEKGIKINAMCPGWVRTDMGGPNAPRHVGEGADTAVWLATEKEIPTGKFFRDRKEIDW